MADACPGTSAAKLSWLVAWYIRDETYQKGLAEPVNYQHRLPFPAYWLRAPPRHPTVSASGPAVTARPAGIETRSTAMSPACCSNTHISDQHAPFHNKVINSPVRDAIHLLDGLLYHQSALRIEEHYTGTAGFTDHVFALPRIALTPTDAVARSAENQGR